MNPVDQWRAIERLVALGWTEEAIGVALTDETGRGVRVDGTGTARRRSPSRLAL